MNAFPKHWKTRDLETCVEILDGKRVPVNADDRAKRQGKIPYYGATGQAGWIDDYIFNEELVLVGEDGAPFYDKTKSVAFMINGKAWVNNHAHVLKAADGVTLNRFVLHYLNYFDYTGYVGGTTRLKLTQGSLRKIPFPLPPLPEQKRIVAKLDTLFAHLDQLRSRLDKIPVLLKQFRQAVLTQAVTGKLTEEWRKTHHTSSDYIKIIDKKHLSKNDPVRYRERKGFLDQIDLVEIPETWKWVNNYKLAKDGNNSICAGPFGTIFKAKDFRKKGIPIIFLRHIKPGQFEWKKNVWMDAEVWKAHHQPYSVSGGELLVTKLGDPPGDAAIYPTTEGIAMVTPDVIKMAVDEEVALTKYILYFFNSKVSKDILRNVSFGMTRLRIDITMFKAMPIPLPSIQEQKAIVQKVEALFDFADHIEKRFQTLNGKIEHLPGVILSKAFRGGLVKNNIAKQLKGYSQKAEDLLIAAEPKNAL